MHLLQNAPVHSHIVVFSDYFLSFFMDHSFFLLFKKNKTGIDCKKIWRCGNNYENSVAKATNHVFLAQKITSGKGSAWQNSISGKNGSKNRPIFFYWISINLEYISSLVSNYFVYNMLYALHWYLILIIGFLFFIKRKITNFPSLSPTLSLMSVNSNACHKCMS